MQIQTVRIGRFADKFTFRAKIAIKIMAVLVINPFAVPLRPPARWKVNGSAPGVVVGHGFGIAQKLFPEPEILRSRNVKCDHTVTPEIDFMP